MSYNPNDLGGSSMGSSSFQTPDNPMFNRPPLSFEEEERQKKAIDSLPPMLRPIDTKNPQHELPIKTYDANELNIHQNPYGAPAYDPRLQQQHPQFPLPSKDIPRDVGVMYDPLTQAGYIPPLPQQGRDYTLQYQDPQHYQKRHRKSKIDELIQELQVPFFLGLLFFIFQLPFFNESFFKMFPFLTAAGETTVPSAFGLFCKSAMFSGFYYFFLKLVQYYD
jgi:hypothetical protein